MFFVQPGALYLYCSSAPERGALPPYLVPRSQMTQIFSVYAVRDFIARPGAVLTVNTRTRGRSGLGSVISRSPHTGAVGQLSV